MVGRTALRKIGGFSMVVGMVLAGLGVAAPPAIASNGQSNVGASAAASSSTFTPDDPNVTVTDGGANCNGIVPTKADSNTDKTLVGFGADQNHPKYAISYPADPNNVGDFTITDCMLLGNVGQDLKAMTVIAEATFDAVNNSATFKLGFTVDISAVNPQPGQQVCNVAKTTASPSHSPASNRKAGAACFIVGGDQRVEKRDSATGALITAGTAATFRIACAYPVGSDPTVQPVVVNTTNVPAAGTVDVQSNTLAFNGPSNATCTVKELSPPSGYDPPTVGVCVGSTTPPACDTITVTIGVGSAQNVIGFDNRATPVEEPVTRSLTVSKSISGGTGSFALHVDCADGTAHDANYTVTQNTTEPAITGIPDGTSCTVSEDDPGTGWSTTVNGANGRSATVTMDQDRTEAFVNTFTAPTTTTTVAPTTTTTAAPTTTTTAPPAQVLAEVIQQPAATPAATPAAPAAQVEATQLPRTGRELGLTAKAGAVLIALGLMALAAGGRKREPNAAR